MKQQQGNSVPAPQWGSSWQVSLHFHALLLVLVFSLVWSSRLFAGNFAFSGNLVTDNSAKYYEFTLGQAQLVVIQTDSYALNAGFDPVLTLFDGQGSWLATNDNKLPGFDAEIEQTLASGRYILAVTQSGNFAQADGQPAGNLSQGFTASAGPGFGGRSSYVACFRCSK